MSENPPFSRTLAYWLVATLGYYVAGLLGLALAIPPGFASAVWPASGLALALGILYPLRAVALGIFVGSFLLNVFNTSDQFQNISWAAILLPSQIAFGATCQLLVGYYLYRRLIGIGHLINNPAYILRFSSFVAPISCLVASLTGTLALFSHDFIEKEQAMFTWLTWWIGDTIGILLFTPMLLTLFANSREFGSKRKLQIIIPSTVIFIFAYFLFMWSQQNRNEKADNIIDDHANFYTQKIHERLQVSRNKLLSYQAYFQGSHDISYGEFNEFSRVLLDKTTVLNGVGWTKAIPHKQRAETEASIRKQGYPDFTFTRPNKLKGMQPIEDKAWYYPVLYIYPLKDNKKAHGLDLSSLPGRLEILERIAMDGQPKATAPITLIQEAQQEKATILYMPVWDQFPQNTNLLGYVSGIYRFSSIVSPVIELANKDAIAMSIYDVTDKNEPYELIKKNISEHKNYSSKKKNVIFENRIYEVHYHPTSDFDLTEKDWISWVILITGFLLAALLQAFILMMTGTIEYTSRVVNERTKQLKQATKKAQQASEAKSMFLANMSHELRTPLNAIVGLINLCLKTNLNSQQETYLKQSKLASETLVLLINQTLDYAKIESGKLELEQSEFDLSILFTKIYAIFNVKAQENNIEFKLVSNQVLPKYLNGDALRIEQVLLNLLSNAFKFTQEGFVHITLDLDHELKKLRLTVKDSGIGIAKSQQIGLFESFKQADNSTTRKFGGTGLGLAISKQIVELMKGTISLVSDTNKGCQFIIDIPLQLTQNTQTFSVDDVMILPTDDLDHAAMIQPDKTQACEGAYLSQLNILLVEDIEINRMIATELLEAQGARVIPAVDGQDAIDQLEQADSVDLVLMDIQMPVLDGYMATQAIRKMEAYKSLPIIAMTANAMAEDVKKAKASGMDGHIAKPIDEANMMDVILRVLGTS